jgi:hypothetical protein
MTEGQPRREGGHPAPGPPRPASDAEITIVGPLTGDDAGDDAAGGDPVCWAHLVCEECGAITAEGHRAGCSRRGP